MDPKTKTLRQYQEKLVYDVCRSTDDALVEQPTGSGKTVEIVTLVAMHLSRRFTHAVISAPQEQIEQGFVKRDYNIVAFPQHRGVAVPSIQVPKHTSYRAEDPFPGLSCVASSNQTAR
jgi:superfamily II DNA or RNA helicase